MRAENRRPADETRRPQPHHPHGPISVAEALQLGQEDGPRGIGLDIDPSLLTYDGAACTLAMSAAEARHTARVLLAKAADADRVETALAMEAACISVIPICGDGKPAVDNWEEYQHRRATPDEIRAWFGSGSTPGAP